MKAEHQRVCGEEPIANRPKKVSAPETPASIGQTEKELALESTYTAEMKSRTFRSLWADGTLPKAAIDAYQALEKSAPGGKLSH